MKTLGLYLTLSAIAVSGSLSGCYTQLAIQDDESEAVVDNQLTEVLEPSPTAVIIEPIYIPIAPPYCPPPFAGVAAPGAGSPPPVESPIRNTGNHRSDSGRSESAPSNTRITGSTRGGR